MRLRKWIGVLAALGVLLHAGALVRHNAAALSAHLQHQTLVADLHQLCDPTGSGAVDGAGLPDIPRPFDARKCPICAGLASLFALAGPEAVALPIPAARPADRVLPVVILGMPAYSLHPPARGPPAFVQA